jgi:DNA-binding response OmpR family regulator
MSRILIAEDEADLRDFLRDELSDAGFRVTAVANGAEAIVTAVENTFDLVVLDMLMPGLDGIQTIQVLRKVVPDVPIIGLTGYMGRGYMARAADYGITCLSKPVDMDELIQEIKHELA